MPNYQLDKDHANSVMVISPVCFNCHHFKRSDLSERRCSAFGNIPLEIWNGQNDHTKPYPKDNGIRFESVRSD